MKELTPPTLEDTRKACALVQEWIEENTFCGSGLAMREMCAAIFNSTDYPYPFNGRIWKLDGWRKTAMQTVLVASLLNVHGKEVATLVRWVVENYEPKRGGY